MSENIQEGIFNNKNIEKFRELGLWGFIILLSVFVQLRSPSFLSPENISDLFTNASILSILVAGMMLVIITRGIDLSVAAVLAFSGMITAMTVNVYPGLPPFVLILLSILIGMVCGAINGFLVAKMSILPIIATLGMMNVFRGVTFLISGGKWVSAYQMSDSFKSIATGSMLGINNLIVIAIVIYIIFYYFVNYTRTGRKIYAVGNNPESARISGINADKILWMVYTIMGGLAGLSGALWVAKYASAQSNTASGYELTVITACVVGGIDIAGGRGKVFGAISGALLLGILSNALPLINVSPFWQDAIQGCIILLAVVISALVKRGSNRSLIRRES